MTTTNNGITKTFSTISVDGINQSPYNPNKFSAQVRQQVTTTYPAMRVGNSKTGGLFDLSEFNIPDGQSYTSTRVAWIPVPAGKTVEEVVAQLATRPDARIYREISFNLADVLTDEQIGAVNAGLTTMSVLEEKLRVRKVDTDGTISEIDGPRQYSQNFFNPTATADIDHRPVAQRTIISEQPNTDALTAAKAKVEEKVLETAGDAGLSV